MNSALLTDQYQLVMAHGYWQLAKAEQEAVFQLYFRNHPFNGNYTVCCGLESVIDYLQNWHFSNDDIEYLSSLKNSNQQPLFPNSFLHYLKTLRFTGHIDAIPEGTLVFPNEPLLRITAPLIQCQLLETPLINLINFASLIATKAARTCQAAQGDPVIEFGLRRAQGPDGGLTASRAAYIGGCIGTSNVLAGKQFDIPIKGTQAHSWIMAFPDEITAFKAFADTTPGDVILLVDTYDTLTGVQNAIKIGHWLRQQQRDLAGIRLDSGDLANLSKQARQLLDAAGFTNTKITASSDIDEYKIAALKAEKACIDMWGVGTRLVTAYDQPALNVIYKMAALKKNQQWNYKVKISDDPIKSTTPGIHQVRRYTQSQTFFNDVIYDIDLGIPSSTQHYTDLLIPIFRQGKLVYTLPTIHDIRHFCHSQINSFTNMPYPVQFADNLKLLKK